LSKISSGETAKKFNSDAKLNDDLLCYNIDTNQDEVIFENGRTTLK